MIKICDWGDQEFRRTYYATVLDACMGQCTDIGLMGDGKKAYIEKKIEKYRLGKELNIYNFSDLTKWLDEELVKVCNENKNVLQEDIEKLVIVRRCLNQIFYSLYIKRKQGDKASKLDRLLRVSCYTLSKCVSKNVFLSRKFYTTLRMVWYYSFKGKFVENWKQCR